MTNPEISDRDIIRSIARKFGTHLKPAEYISKAKDKPYNREISNSTVCKTLGCYSSRADTNIHHATNLAKQLLTVCRGDLNWAEFVITKAYQDV